MSEKHYTRDTRMGHHRNKLLSWLLGWLLSSLSVIDVQATSVGVTEVCNTTFDEVYANQIQNRVSGETFGANGSRFHYMDFTGSGVFLDRQVNETAHLYHSGVFGNPHSKSYSSKLSTEYVEAMRAKIMEFFSADPDEYEMVFTRSATGALSLLGGSFPFSSGEGSSYAYTVSNHNSVLGIRAYAEENGAKVSSVTEEEIEEWLENDSQNPEQYKGTVFEGNTKHSTKTYSLFAYPAKDNYEGVLYPKRWIDQVKGKSTDQHEWMVLLDTAAYAPTYRLNLSEIHPDFLVISFYKVFGLPTGVGMYLYLLDIVIIIVHMRNTVSFCRCMANEKRKREEVEKGILGWIFCIHCHINLVMEGPIQRCSKMGGWNPPIP